GFTTRPGLIIAISHSGWNGWNVQLHPPESELLFLTFNTGVAIGEVTTLIKQIGLPFSMTIATDPTAPREEKVNECKLYAPRDETKYWEEILPRLQNVTSVVVDRLKTVGIQDATFAVPPKTSEG